MRRPLTRALLVAALASGCAGHPGAPLGQVSAAVTANSEVGAIEIFVDQGDQRVYDSGRQTPAGTDDDRRTLQVGFALPAGHYVATANAYDANGGLAGTTNLAHGFDVVAGQATSFALVIDLSPAGGTNAGGVDLTAVTDFAPTLYVSWSAPPAVGQPFTLDYTATDRDPGDTLTFFTLVIDGELGVETAPSFGNVGNPFVVTPLGNQPFHLVAGVVDSLGRADFWRLHGDPTTGAVQLDEEVGGYAIDLDDVIGFRRPDGAGEQAILEAVVLQGAGYVELIVNGQGDNGSPGTARRADASSPLSIDSAVSPEDDLRWGAGASIVSLDLSAASAGGGGGGGAGAGDGLLGVTIAGAAAGGGVYAVDQTVVLSGEGGATLGDAELASGSHAGDPLPAAPGPQSLDRDLYAPGDAVTIIGTNLDDVTGVRLINQTTGQPEPGAITITGTSPGEVDFPFPPVTDDSAHYAIRITGTGGAQAQLGDVGVQISGAPPASPDVITFTQTDSDLVSLSWRTTCDPLTPPGCPDHFLVESSSDGLSFSPLANVTSSPGSDVFLLAGVLGTDGTSYRVLSVDATAGMSQPSDAIQITGTAPFPRIDYATTSAEYPGDIVVGGADFGDLADGAGHRAYVFVTVNGVATRMALDSWTDSLVIFPAPALGAASTVVEVVTTDGKSASAPLTLAPLAQASCACGNGAVLAICLPSDQGCQQACPSACGGDVVSATCAPVNLCQVPVTIDDVAASGNVLTITGSGFGPGPGSVEVDLAGSADAASILSWNATSVSVALAAAPSFPYQVRVQTAAGLVAVASLSAPIIDAITPAPLPVATTAVLTGESLGDRPGTLLLGGVSLAPLTWADGQITFAVDASVGNGTYTLQLGTTSGGTASTTLSICHSPCPELDSVTAGAPQGNGLRPINITGQHLGSVAGTVTFSSASARLAVTTGGGGPGCIWGDTGITCTQAVASGPRHVTVVTASGITLGKDFVAP